MDYVQSKLFIQSLSVISFLKRTQNKNRVQTDYPKRVPFIPGDLTQSLTKKNCHFNNIRFAKEIIN